MTNLRLHVVPLANQELDGAGMLIHAPQVTAVEFAALIERVNPFFAPAGIQFVFDPEVDWRPQSDTELNSDGANMWSRGNQLAAGISGKVLCLLRWGSDPFSPTGNGNAYPPPGAGPVPANLDDVEQNYIALPSRIGPGASFLDLGSGSFLAHEVGHYLGLYHTFPGWSDLFGPVYAGQTPSDAAAADQAVINYIMNNGGTIDALDGDRLSDTPPDPSPVLYRAHQQDICVARAITISGTWGGQPVSFTLQPDANIIMSYFGACPPGAGYFTPHQIARMQQTLTHANRKHLIEVPCPPDFHDFPADRFQQCFNYWVNRGAWPATVSFARHDNATFVSGSFQPGCGRRVRSLFGPAELRSEADALARSGQRPHQVSVLDDASGQYTAVWGPTRAPWKLEIELDAATYESTWHARRAEGWVQVDLSIRSGAAPLFTSIWERRPGDYASFWGMTAQEYQDRFTQLGSNGLRTIRFCRYVDGGNERFAAIWEKLPGTWAHYFGLDHAAYQTRYNEMAQQGFRLHQLHAYDRWFSGIWHVPGIGRSLGGALTSGPAASTRGIGSTDVFYCGPDKSVHWIARDGGPWSRPESIGGTVESAPAAVSWDGDRTDVFAEGTDHLLYVATRTGGRWGGWSWLGDPLGSAPAVCSMRTGRLDVFYRRADGALMQRTFDGAWQAAVSRGGTLASKPAAVAWSNNRLDVFARFTDDTLWHLWFDGTWHPWERLDGVLRSAPAACSMAAGRLDVFARGTDDALWHKWFDGTWSGWESLGGFVNSDPAAVSWGPGRIDVFARGTDAALWRKTWNGAWVD